VFICPYDCRWCDLQICRSGSCKVTHDKTMVACLDCGAVVEVSCGFRLCVDCFFADIMPPKKEHEHATPPMEG